MSQARLQLCMTGNPLLRRVAKSVSTEELAGREMQELLHRMLITLDYHDAWGLAAPQVGSSRRFFSWKSRGNMPRVAVNPSIHHRSSDLEYDYEGCLSIPSVQGRVLRANWIEVSYLDQSGENIESKKLTGLEARVFQHELDHLNGVLFVDRLMRDAHTLSVSQAQGPEDEKNALPAFELFANSELEAQLQDQERLSALLSTITASEPVFYGYKEA